MAWTQAQIDKLKDAIAGWGVLKSITFEGQTFEKDELDKALKLLVVMQEDVNATAGTTSNYRLAATSKGV